MSKLTKACHFDQSFQQLFNSFLYPDRHSLTRATWSPACDIVEDKANNITTIGIDIPGMTLEDISVSIDNRVLTISGERKKVTTSDNGYNKSEVVYGKFVRNFILPSNLDSDSVVANYKDGILRVELKHLKEENKVPKLISISS